MSRLGFLKQSGGFLTAAALGSYCSGGRFPSGLVDPMDNARWAGLSDPIHLVLAAGISAPNPHNTQPWKFRIISSTEAELYVDLDRILPETDPTMRQVHMSQGCLLELTSVAAGELSMETRISLFPSGYSLPADAGKKPVARISLRPSGKKDPLYRTIAERRTVRSAYQGPAITPQEYGKLKSITTSKVAELRETQASDLNAHLEFHFKGMKVELDNFPTAEESRKWFRIGDSEIYEKRDGISLASNGIQGFQRWFIETFILSHDPEDYYDESGQKMFIERYRENLLSVKGQILFITKTNTVKDWVLCGRDYARMQLAAQSMGLVMRPTSQLMQEFEAMKPLAKQYNDFLGVKAPAKIQINALLGRSEEDYQAPRRPLKNMIIA